MKTYEEKNKFERIESRINAVLDAYEKAEKEGAYMYNDGIVKGLKIARELLETVKEEC